MRGLDVLVYQAAPMQPGNRPGDFWAPDVVKTKDGWQIDYTGYMPGSGDGNTWLPSRMTVQRTGVRVRLIVDGWTS